MSFFSSRATQVDVDEYVLGWTLLVKLTFCSPSLGYKVQIKGTLPLKFYKKSIYFLIHINFSSTSSEDCPVKIRRQNS